MLLNDDVSDSNKAIHDNNMNRIKQEYWRKKELERKRYYLQRKAKLDQNERRKDAELHKKIDDL